MPLPVASLSLDLDNLWSYLKTHGEPGWELYPSYLQIVVPRVLQFLKQRKLKITWFIVGKDADDTAHHDVLKSIIDEGHEVGNHSYHHEPWLHLYSRDEIRDELIRTEDAIQRATGVRPVGFRGPGFSHSKSLLEVLAERGYLYDCSTFPTFLGPLARLYYLATAKNLSPEEREKRKKLFGRWNDGFKPIHPYNVGLSNGRLLEIPVTVMPIFRFPIDISYLLYLAGYSVTLAKVYWRTALTLCRSMGIELSLLLHPLDFMGIDDTDRLSFFPAMREQHHNKLHLVSVFFDQLMSSFECISMGDHANRLSRRKLTIATI